MLLFCFVFLPKYCFIYLLFFCFIYLFIFYRFVIYPSSCNEIRSKRNRQNFWSKGNNFAFTLYARKTNGRERVLTWGLAASTSTELLLRWFRAQRTQCSQHVRWWKIVVCSTFCFFYEYECSADTVVCSLKCQFAALCAAVTSKLMLLSIRMLANTMRWGNCRCELNGCNHSIMDGEWNIVWHFHGNDFSLLLDAALGNCGCSNDAWLLE